MEQTLLVDKVENQVKAQRLEGMMAQVLLETRFGQNVTNQTMEIISFDPAHETLESQYLSAQTMRLIDSLQKLVISGKLVLDAPLHHPAEPCRQIMKFIEFPFTEVYHSEVVHEILGVVLQVNKSHDMQIPLGPMKDTIIGLGGDLNIIGMTAESIAWELLLIQIFPLLDRSEEALPIMAHAQQRLSEGYQQKGQWQSALKASQQSLDLWSRISARLPEVDNRLSHLTVLTGHARNFLETNQTMMALSTAQNAMVVSSSMLQDMTASSSGVSKEEESGAIACRDAHFILARVFASLDKHAESYEASKEGFETALRFRLVKHPCEFIGLFLEQICKAAEGGRFSLGMLQESTILFRDLAHIYPEHLSFQFLWLLHAYAYSAQQDNSSSTSPFVENIRLFLEPQWDSPPPKLDITKPIPLDFDLHGSIIEDAVRAFSISFTPSCEVLIQNILVAHFDQAIVPLQDVALDPVTSQQVFFTITKAVPVVSNQNQMSLRQILRRSVEHISTVLTKTEWTCHVLWVLWPAFHDLWETGLLEEALGVCKEVIKYFESHLNADSADFMTSWQLKQHFILFEMGRFSDVIKLVLQANIMQVPGPNFLYTCIFRTHMLYRTNRHQEALQVIRKAVAAGCLKCPTCQKHLSVHDKVFQFELYFLHVELAATWNHIGHHERALKAAERVVTICRKEVNNADVQRQKCLLIHSLTTLSNCLASVERNIDALAIAQEAVLMYTENELHLWDSLYTIRKHELGGNAFYALSQRLVTFHEAGKALLNAEKATALYHDLVELAPRHLSTLASSLQNQASILWDVGCQDKAITACKEAVNILRKLVDPEPHFLPSLAEALTQLAGYLTKTGDVDIASTARTECAEVQRRFALLPPQPKFLFEAVMPIDLDNEDSIDFNDEDSEGEEEAWETASEAEAEEYQDASESVEVASKAAHIMSNSSAASCLDENIPPVLAASPTEKHDIMDTVSSMKSLFTEISSKPMEIKLSVHMQSTLMNILWWMLLGIFLAILCRSGCMNLV
ncbi:hypothetical protein K438DRAFT_915966 [Mycena galopus ATCC 62051]|nr:hypothetical protein K438DRAFT_915966 [Mycena galopus ATCC 62051]